MKKSYVRTRLSAIPECGWQWDVLNPFDESHPWGQVKVALELHRIRNGLFSLLLVEIFFLIFYLPIVSSDVIGMLSLEKKAELDCFQWLDGKDPTPETRESKGRNDGERSLNSFSMRLDKGYSQIC